jgi:predicted dehydrogenase
MRETIRIGVVGVGHMGEYHVRTYAELPNVKLVGVADINEERAREIGARYNTIPYIDYRFLYGKCDAVSIAVPTTLHSKVARDFLDAGIHVLIEKPMTDNLKDAIELIELAKEKGLVLHVGQVERFNGAVQELSVIVKDPLLIEARRLGPFVKKRINDTGVILDLIIHDVDIVLNLVPSKIKRISVTGKSIYTEFEDIATVQLTFENGCMATITASRATENKLRTLSITQPDAYIFLDYTDQELHIHRQASSGVILSKDALRYKQESFIERLFVHKDNPLKLEILHFLDCIVNGASPLFSPQDDLKSLEVTLRVLDEYERTK